MAVNLDGYGKPQSGGIFAPAPKHGIYRVQGGYYQAYYRGRIVAYNKVKAYCAEVLNLYQTGVLK